MKKLVCILILFFTFSCSKDYEKPVVSDKFKSTFSADDTPMGNSKVTPANIKFESPKIIFQCNYKVTLPPNAHQAIKKYDSSFRVWQQKDYDPDRISLCPVSKTQSPSTLVRDFNEDGYHDIALSGKSNDESVIMVLLSNNDISYEVYELYRHEHVSDDKFKPPILFLQGKGYSYEYGDMVAHTFTLENDAVGIKYWANNKWNKEAYYWDEVKKNFFTLYI